LSPLELIRLTWTARGIRTAVNDYLGAVFNPHVLLSPFFHDTIAFRYLQAETGTLVSGPTALNFFDRANVTQDPIDIYVYLHHSVRVASWLVGLGYAFLPSPDQCLDWELAVVERTTSTDDQRAIFGVFIFQRSRRTVRLTVANRTPIEVILRAHSTCLLNIISYERAYCLYPRATLHERHSLLIHVSGRGWAERVEEILDGMNRGLDVIDTLDSSEFSLPTAHASFVLGWCWIDDKSAWVINFDTSNVAPPLPANTISSPRTHDPVAMCGFSMRYAADDQARIKFSLLQGLSLEYGYALADRDLLDRVVYALYLRSPIWDPRKYVLV
ncbi:hypothetical protein C8Q79DRAFT_918657, partial [Trametes meyenii]